MSVITAPNSSSKQRTILNIVGGIIILAAFACILGWVFHADGLRRLIPGTAAMKFNTAFCFLLAGIAFILLLYCDRVLPKLFCRVASFLIIAFALLSLSQDVFHWSAGIDELFFKDPARFPFLVPGRMTPMTDICFIIMGSAFLVIYSENTFYKKTAQYLLHGVTLLSVIILMEYLFHAESPGKFSMLSIMAVCTVLSFLLLSVAASSINHDIGFTGIFTGSGIGNIIARRLFPRMVISLVILGYVSVELERHGYISAEFGTILSTLSFLLISLFLIRDTLSEMNRLDQERSRAENETLMLNRNLEDMVARRTLDLKQSNDRIVKIINASPAGIGMTSLESGLYVDVNPSFLEILGYTREEVIGHTSVELNIVDAKNRKRIVDALRNEGYMRNGDIVLNRKDGNELQCKLSTELVDYHGEKYVMSFIHDITEMKDAERSLQDAKKDLEILTDKLTHQNKRLLEFAQITSHNLRSPVSNLNLLIHFYKESNTAEDKHDLWTNFETVVQHLNVTLDELLETLKIQEDTSKQREELSFQDMLNRVKDMLVGQIKESNAIIITDFAKAPTILYPKSYLESIMLNLVSNAIKYRSPDRAPQIKLVTDNTDGQLSLTVEDNGLGIDMLRHKGSLFGLRKTFHRHDEARGLGLFITKTQIESMGGEVSAESEVDKGTTFKVIFNKHF